MSIYAEKNMRCAQFSEIFGNNRNMRQSHKTGIVHHAILHYWKRDVTSTQSNPIQHTQPSGHHHHHHIFVYLKVDKRNSYKLYKHTNKGNRKMVND